MNLLAIESSCDETAAAVVRDGREILSSHVSSQIALHTPYGGVVPELAARAHLEMLAPVVDAASDPLFEALRALRRDIAKEAGVPPYVVFHDSTLREMAQARPETLSALAEISGVGARKRDAYGDRFVAAIREFG